MANSDEARNDEVKETRTKKPANKIVVFIICIVIVIALVAAAFLILKKGKTDAKAENPVQEETIAVDPAQNAATFAEYKDTLEKIFQSINKAIASTNMEDEQEVIALIDIIKPYYDQVSTLTPPQGLEETDAKLKEACKKSSEALQLSRDILTVGDNPTADDIVKVTRLQSTMSDLNVTQTQIEDALNVIYNTTTDQLNQN